MTNKEKALPQAQGLKITLKIKGRMQVFHRNETARMYLHKEPSRYAHRESVAENKHENGLRLCVY